MKSLLSTIGALVVASGSPALFVDKVEQNEAYSTSIKWSSDGSDRAVVTEGSPGQEIRWIDYWTYNIGSSKSYNSISLVGNDSFQFSWGGAGYGPWYFGTKSINLDANSQGKVDGSNWQNYLQFEIYDKDIPDGLARLRASLEMGYAWYQEGGDYYIQIVVFQYYHAMNTFSGGASWSYFGTGFQLS